MSENNNRPGHPTTIVVLAVIIVAAVSMLPIEKFTGGFVKDFSLVADVMHTSAKNDDDTVDARADIDPELQKLMDSTPTDSSAVVAQESVGKGSNITNNIIDIPDGGAPEHHDSIVHKAPLLPPLPEPKAAVRDSNGIVPIEDYTVGGSGLNRLRRAIASGGKARIAVVGDSYIEGDIFTQDLRALLQQHYGGSGVGYMALYSEFPGFRRSVRQSGGGWNTFTAGKGDSNYKYQGLAEHYFKPAGAATATYKGTDKVPCAGEWDYTRFLYVAPSGGSVTLTTGEETRTFTLIPSDSVKSILVAQTVNNVSLSTSTGSLIALGMWLDSSRGVSVDCMSSRGFSGLTLSRINVDLCRQMSEYIDYDLIILEFGINAMSARQKDYSVYTKAMVKVIEHVRKCYPNADILLMGIGDRGEKKGGDVKSMISAPYMVEAQRTAARTARCMFWDTRQAMGGEDAIVGWARGGLANKDYIHMTHKGGARLANEMFNSLQQLLR